MKSTEITDERDCAFEADLFVSEPKAYKAAQQGRGGVPKRVANEAPWSGDILVCIC